MGTLLDLYEYSDRPHEINNIKNPDIVARVHQEYIDAGAEIIETNTFSANRFRLSQFHLQDRLKEINKAASKSPAALREIVSMLPGRSGRPESFLSP